MAVTDSDSDVEFKHEFNNVEHQEIPPAVDPERPPQRNDDNATGVCAGPVARAVDATADDDGGGSGDDFSIAISTEPGESGVASKASSEAGETVDDGDEGTEDHLIEVGDFGYIPISLIHRTLAKHARCTCHRGILPSLRDYPFTTHSSPSMSGMVSPVESMVVELSSGELSMASSSLFSIDSRGSSLLDYMHGGVDHDASLHGFPLLFNPLPLTASLTIGYPLELSVSSMSEWETSAPAEDFADYDMW